MKITSFLKLVEIQTKVASMIPFILGTLYTIYRYDEFSLMNLMIMFFSLLTFDMATTAINNYCDYKKAHKREGFGYEEHNAIVAHGLRENMVKGIIASLLIIATIFGLTLVYRTSVILLFLGAISFGVGVVYSFGPIPISRTPFGELFSGFFMGVLIVFISIYIHIWDSSILTLNLNGTFFEMSGDYLEILKIFIFSIPLFGGISNIMLANNICDIDDDIANKRYTLPIYIGKKASLNLFRLIYVVSYLSLAISISIGLEPLLNIGVLMTAIIVKKHIEEFFKTQSKKETFVLSVKNFIIINGARIVGFAVYILMEAF